jgi:archaeal chaperonin
MVKKCLTNNNNKQNNKFRLKEGTRETKKKDAQSNNISAARTIAEILKSGLGPRGMDKMLVNSLEDVTITNDGATILKEN